MFAVTAAATVALSTAGWAQNPQAIMSWGTTCPTIITNAQFPDPANPTRTSYTMFIAAHNLTASDGNVGTDINLFYGRGIPDAWRFDDAGCQTGSQVALNNNGNTKACPAMKGTNPLTITNFQLYTMEPTGQQRMNVRLAITYDNFVPASGTTYTLWNVVFDHSFSVVGPSNPGVTCGGAETPICIAMTDPAVMSAGDYANFQSGVLALSGIQEPFSFASPTDGYVTWNGGANCPGTVPTQQSTWGKVKALYHN
jgi:hypothetical protein